VPVWVPVAHRKTAYSIAHHQTSRLAL